MATKNFRSTVLEPTSEFAHGDKLRFTALATVGEVLKGSFSETTIGEDGVYSVDLQYGKHRIDYKPYEGVWRHFADVEVNADTLATTLQDLALASVPVTDEAVLVLQGILADAEAAKTESAALRDEAAASAAAAAEDAEKLADVTPDSIGAVNNVIGKTAFKPDGSEIQLPATFTRYILVELPVSSNTFIGLRARTLSRDVKFNNEIFISFYNHIEASAVLGLTCYQTSIYEFTYDIYRSTDKSKTFIVISTESTFYDTLFSVLDVCTFHAESGAEIWSKNWAVTASDDIGADKNLIASITTTNQVAVSAPAAVSIEYDGQTYTHTDRDSALKIDGIPLAVFDTALAEQQANDLFNSEKSIALQIFADFNLGTGEHEITGSDIADVRAYIQSIDPAKGLKAGHLQRAKIPRPSIFDRYKKNPYEL